MGSDWLKKKCAKGCGGTVFYLAQWSAAPKYCDRCRLAEIDDLSGLLKRFLDHEAKIGKQMRTLQDKQLFAERDALRVKVRSALGKGGCKPDQLVDVCLHDKDIIRLVFRLANEQRLDNRPARGSKNTLPKTLAPFLQGGAPGLGKRS